MTSSVYKTAIVRKVDIPLCLVGWMIGPRGSKLLEIQTQSNCQVWLNQQLPDNQPRELIIQGDCEENVALACRLVEHRLHSAPVSQDLLAHVNGQSNSDGGTGSGLQATVVDIPAHLLGLLIGRNGWTLKRLVRQSGARITIDQSGGPLRPKRAVIYGTESSVVFAARYIQDLVQKGLASWTPPPTAGSAWGAAAGPWTGLAPHPSHWPVQAPVQPWSSATLPPGPPRWRAAPVVYAAAGAEFGVN